MFADIVISLVLLSVTHRARTQAVLAHHPISEQWHSDQARNELGGWSADVHDESFLIPGHEGLSSGYVVGVSDPFLGFEHCWEDIWRPMDGIGDVDDGGISDVFNSDYPLDSDNIIASLPQLQTGYLLDTNSSAHYLPTSSLFSTPLNSPGNTGSQTSSDTMSRWPDDVGQIQDSCFDLPSSLTAGGIGLANVSNRLWLSASGQSIHLVGEDASLATHAMPKATLKESILEASLNDISSGNTVQSQIQLCDFKDCGRLYESHKKLK